MGDCYAEIGSHKKGNTMEYNVINTQDYLIEEAHDILRENGCKVRYQYLEDLSADEIIAQLQGMDAVIAGSEDYSPRVLESADRLKVIARTGAGVDHVNLPAATKCGIQVTNTPGATSDAVADLTIGMAICLLRKIPQMVCSMKKDRWQPCTGRELGSMTLGVIGAGSIGKAVIKRAKSFGSKVLAHDIVPDEDFAAQYGVEYVSLDELLRQADIVTLHVGLSDDTSKVIDGAKLGLMKKSAYLINTSRPGLIDKDALYEQLKAGKLAGAALDVHDPKPCAPGDPLVRMENVMTTPWMGYNTHDAIRKMCMAATRDLVAVLKGDDPIFPVNEVAEGVCNSTSTA